MGIRPPDSDELRVRKEVLTLSAALMATASFAWVGTYAVLGLWLSAAIPFAYQVASAGSIWAFARTGDFRLFRRSQLWMSLLLPFALQWSLGGFENSSAVSLWAFTSPLGALLFVGPREAVPWFVAFALLIGVSVAIDPALAASAPDIPSGVVLAFFGLTILGVTGTSYLLLQYFVRDRERERERSERLLLTVLPPPVAERLKREEGVIADAHDSVTVLFADLVGFTTLAARRTPSEVVSLLDAVFARWDAVSTRYGVEKIKTLGDEYRVAAGMPMPRDDHSEALAETALEMMAEAERCGVDRNVPLEVRMGIDTGPVVAGVIGRSKFIYDLWGDTVNTASRMESHAPRGGIQVTERAYLRLQQAYVCEPRGPIDIKGKGTMTPYLLAGSRSSPPAAR